MASSDGPIHVARLTPADVGAMRAMNAMFAAAFEDPQNYGGAPPSDAYLAEQLEKPHVIALAAWDGEALVGGIVAYELDKLEQARREIYIYDLAVAETHRRRGVATMMIGWLQDHAIRRGAWVVYVQADLEDDPAVALYDKLGVREDVLHFDIAPKLRS